MDAVALFNHSYLKRLYEVKDDENVMESNHVNECVEHGDTWILWSTTTNRLLGFVVFGAYKAYDDWPKWQKKSTPPNSSMLEIKLIASRKGYGRLLMAFALFRNLHKPYRAAVLEVLGGEGNYRAIKMYQQFGFERQKAFDTDEGPTVQMRNKWGNIVYMMTLVPKPGDPILLLENLKNLLTKSKLMEFARTKRNQRRDDQVDPEDNKLSPQLYTHRVHEAGASSQVYDSESIHPTHSAYLAPVAPVYSYGSTPPQMVKHTTFVEVSQEIEQLEELWRMGFIQREEFERRHLELFHLQKTLPKEWTTT